jgi:AbrB family looped-hinge helix DNA binding protein
MNSKGRTVIPKAIRERLGLQPGDVLDFVVQDDGDVVIRPTLGDVRCLKFHNGATSPCCVHPHFLGCNPQSPFPIPCLSLAAVAHRRMKL